MEYGRRNPVAWLGIALVVALALMALLGVLTMSSYTGYGMMGGYWGWGLLMMGAPAVFLIVILVIALGGLEDRGARPVVGYPSQDGMALRVLEDRYARGELTREQYIQMRADLAPRPPQP